MPGIGPRVDESGGGSSRDCGRLVGATLRGGGGGCANTADPCALVGYPGGGTGGARPLATEDRTFGGGRDMSGVGLRTVVG